MKKIFTNLINATTIDLAKEEKFFKDIDYFTRMLYYILTLKDIDSVQAKKICQQYKEIYTKEFIKRMIKELVIFIVSKKPINSDNIPDAIYFLYNVYNLLSEKYGIEEMMKKALKKIEEVVGRDKLTEKYGFLKLIERISLEAYYDYLSLTNRYNRKKLENSYFVRQARKLLQEGIDITKYMKLTKEDLNYLDITPTNNPGIQKLLHKIENYKKSGFLYVIVDNMLRRGVVLSSAGGLKTGLSKVLYIIELNTLKKLEQLYQARH